MSRLKDIRRNPFKAALTLIGVLMVLELAVFAWGIQRRASVNQEISWIETRLAKIAREQVSPNAETLRHLGEANVELLVVVNELHDKLFPSGELSLNNTPANPTAAYFELADFVERMELGFNDAGIEIESNERFGFTQFEQAGPVSENIREVILQKAGMELVLGALVVAEPLRLLECQRHFVGTDEAVASQSVLRQAVRSLSESSRYPDTFSKTSGNGLFESVEVELSFEGYSKSLRTFMTGLQELPFPVTVEGLEISPVDVSGTISIAGDLDDGSRLVITNSPSLFTLRLTVWFDRREPRS